MNQGRIWCVVKPTVGLPIFLAAVAITSLIVHAAILTHVTWMSAYWQGKAKPAVTGMVDPSVHHAAFAATAPAGARVVLASVTK